MVLNLYFLFEKNHLITFIYLLYLRAHAWRSKDNFLLNSSTIRLGSKSLHLLNQPSKCSNTWEHCLEADHCRSASPLPYSHLRINSPLSPAFEPSHSSPLLRRGARAGIPGPWRFGSYLLLSWLFPFVDKLQCS